jgi:hypothetical protein
VRIVLYNLLESLLLEEATEVVRVVFDVLSVGIRFLLHSFVLVQLVVETSKFFGINFLFSAGVNQVLSIMLHSVVFLFRKAVCGLV